MNCYFSCDVEADGPCPGLYSMISFGACLVSKDTQTFYGRTAPISDKYVLQSLAVSKTTREEHLTYPEPEVTMAQFEAWIRNIAGGDRPVLISDNPAFDWQFINYYFHKYCGYNPFGYSARRIGDIYAGLTKDFYNTSGWKKHRVTAHTHHPVDDALGVVEGLIALRDVYGMRT